MLFMESGKKGEYYYMEGEMNRNRMTSNSTLLTAESKYKIKQKNSENYKIVDCGTGIYFGKLIFANNIS